MICVVSKDYDLLLSFDPCDIFRYFGVEKMHGLSVHECELCANTTESAYIAGWCNISPIDKKPFVYPLPHPDWYLPKSKCDLLPDWSDFH